MQGALSKHEWVIMEALWSKSPVFLSDITAALMGVLAWKRSTLMTYMKRLCEKGFVGYDEVRGSRSYYPVARREDCIANESRHMLNKLTANNARLFLASMIRESGLSEQASTELKAIIDSYSDENPQDGEQ